MNTFRYSVAALLSIFFIFYTHSSAEAASAGVAFQKTIALTGSKGIPFDQDMKLLLANPGTPPYKWASGDLPSWLSISGDHLVGTPPTTGTSNFHLTVKDATPEGSDFNHPASITILPPPPQFKALDLDLGTQKEDFAWSDNLKNYLVDGSLATTFSATGLPSWMSLNTQTGDLSGTPRRVDVGNYSGIQFTATGAGGTGTAAGHGVVLKTIHPPAWTQNPLNFPDTLEDSAFSADTLPFISKGDATSFTFTATSNPSWLTVNSTTGNLSGTPHTFGPVSFDLSFNTTIDGQNFNGTTRIQFNVVHVNHAPKWSANPITLANGFTSVGYNQNIASFASDPDANDTLSFKLSGPSWAQIDPQTGAITGTPSKANIGVNTFQATVTDAAGAKDITTVKITVIKSNEPPTWNAHPTMLSDAKEDFAYTYNLNLAASDPDSDPMFFTITSGPAWASVDATGRLVGTPGAGDVGINHFTMKVSDHKSAPDDTTQVDVLVLHTNHPPTWKMDPIILSTNEDVLFSSDVSGYANDVDTSDTLSFSLVSGPAWATLTSKGVLSGTAHIPDEGVNHFVVRVSDSAGATADTHVNVTVIHVNHAPYWTQNPIVLPNAKDDSAYSTSVNSYAQDIDPGDTLKFSKVSSTPSWVTIGTDGSVTGNPKPANVGLNTFQVKVTDAANAEAIVTVQVTVDHVNHAPKWSVNPISLADAFTAVGYSQNIASFSSDPDSGDTLTYTLSGPAWATINPQTGVISGTPAKSDIGANSWTATVKDQFGASDTTTVQITVIKSNEPPIWKAHPTILGDAKEDFVYSANLNLSATDPDSDPLFFTIISGPSWATVDTNGNLTGTPKAGDVGLNKFSIKVSDHKSTPDDTAEVQILVNHTNHAPTWTLDPITLSTNEDVLFTSDISGYAKDVDTGDTLSFSLLSGPAWATLSAKGVISGTAHIPDEGANNFVVRVADNSGASADTHVVITVKHVNHAPFWTQNPIVLPNAKDDEAYSSSISSFAQDIDPGDTLRFAKVSSTPSWVAISSTGQVSGSPKPANVGLNTFQVKVIDAANAEATVTVQITVDHVNHAPKWSANPLTLSNSFTAVAYTQNLAPDATDPDAGDTLSFSMVGPSWATLDPVTGVLSGTPTKADIGVNTWTATVKDQFGATDTTSIKITVIKSNEPPTWNAHPTILAEAKEDSVYSSNLISAASDPDSDPMFFTLISGPSWASIDASGNLSGTPNKANLGLNKFTIRVSDHKSTPDDTAEVQIFVNHVNHAPTWSIDPITMTTTEDLLFTSDISVYAKDIDAGDTLSFSLVSGPSWATLTNKGVISGTPHIPEEGANNFVVRVSDQVGATADTHLIITVLHVNHAPYWTQNPIVLPNAKDDSAYTNSVATYAKDSDPGDTLRFAKSSATPSWVQISSTGQVTGSPKRSDVGLNTFVVTVFDAANAKAEVTVQVTVDHVNHTPKWSANPLNLANAFTAVAYTQNVSSFASDPDAGDTLNFTMTGPAWATMNPTTGVITGTPTKADLGVNTFQATVKDPFGATDVTTIQVTVIKSNEPPTWNTDPTVLASAKEDFSYNVNLNSSATDPDADPLFFTLVSGPAWATIDANGNIKGTPKATDVGLNKFTIKVSDHKSTPDDTAEIQIQVDHTNHAPYWTTDPIVLSTNEDVAFTSDISAFAKDPDAGDTLSFTMISGPAWASLSNNGVVSGTAHLADEGDNQFVVKVADQVGANAEVHLTIKVLHVNHAPYWTQNPIVLPNAKDDAAYSSSIAAFAKDNDPGDTLHFAKVSSTPAWVKIAADGKVSGNPSPKDVGLNSFQVKVVDAANAEALATVQITVDHVNHAPKWSANPIVLANGFSGVSYTQSVNSFASDPDAGDTLSFSLTGPSWATIDAKTGVIKGTPTKADIGLNSWQAVVQDSFGATDTTTIQVTVIKSNEPPTWNNDPTVLANAKEDEKYNVSLNPNATDPDSDPLFFTLVSGPSWATIDASGNLIGTPTAANLGLNKFQIKVSDHKSTPDDTAEIQVTVLHTNHAPYWTADPINVTTKEDVVMSLDLSTYAKDIDAGDTLSFSLVSGPAWASLSSTGVMTGTPHQSEVGANAFVVKVADIAGASADTHLVITVVHVNHAPYWTQNPIVLPNAKDDSAYSNSISSYAKDNDPGDVLHFVKVSTTPAWVKVGSDGSISGNPTSNDVGLNSFEVKVVDAANAEATVTVQITVDHVNHPPKWTKNPIILSDATTGVSYVQNLAQYATDPDAGDKLKFEITGPAWAVINSDTGVFSGTPSKPNTGLNTWTAKVSDSSGASDTTTVQLNVIKLNLPPTWNAKPTLLAEAKEDTAYTTSLIPYAADPDSDPLFFTIVSGPAWATVDAQGNLSGLPKSTDVGINKFNIKVSDHISSPDDVSEVQVLVIHTNHAPFWLINPITFSTYSESPFSASIAAYAKDPDTQDKLKFSLVSGPSWVSLSSDGVFSGTPSPSDEGQNNLVVSVGDESGAIANANVIINVKHPNHAPYWTQNPIVLPDGLEETDYSAELSGFAKDPDGDKLTITLISNTNKWHQVDAKGHVSGTPSAKDVGLNQFDVQVSDPSGLKSVTTVKITVNKINHAPYWTKNPVTMGTTPLESPFSYNLAPFAKDPDQDPLSFDLVSGPAWMKVDATGNLTGTPSQTSEIGVNTATVRVTDPKGLSATTQATVTVLNINHPPVIGTDLPKFTVKERQTISVDLNTWVKDPDGDGLVYTISGAKDWISLSSNGILRMSPSRKDIATYQFNFNVSDGKLSAAGILNVEVVKDPRAPIWLSEPIASLTLAIGQNISASVKDKARDLDNEAINFAKKSGPAWLQLSASGLTSGAPKDSDSGVNKFIFTVCNEDQLCSDGTFVVNVNPSSPVHDVVQVDSAVPGALAENLWVIDNHSDCSSTINALKNNIRYYYEDLNKAQLHHSGIYLSSDAQAFGGDPIHDPYGPMLLLWSQANIVADFKHRMELGYSNAMERCPSCRNSPIWSMHEFYAQAPSINEIWHNQYFMNYSPMDVMVISNRKDNYHHYAQNAEGYENWTAADFANDFTSFHQDNKQTYRISAIAPKCPNERFENPREENAYRTLVNSTKGGYYTDDCHLNMTQVMHDYASKVIFRAYVHAKSHIALSKTPKDPSAIKVSLAGVTLPGNTGSSTDKWSYVAAKNEVEIYWNRIDDSALKPGDKIDIEYTTAGRILFSYR